MSTRLTHARFAGGRRDVRRVGCACLVLATCSSLMTAHASAAARNGSIVFSSNRAENLAQTIGVVRADGTGRRIVTRPNSTERAAPRWSRDSRTIFFHQAEGDAATTAVGAVSVRGGPIRRVAVLPGWDYDVSPDGRKVAYAGWLESRYGIFVADADWSNRRFLAEGALPDWSPDGTKVAFVLRETLDPPGDGGVGVVDVATARTAVVASGLRYYREPDWAPDGVTIAFSAFDPMASGGAGEGQIRLVGVDGTGERRLSAGSSAWWAPDGTMLAVLGSAGFPLQTVRASDGAVVGRLTRRPAEGPPSWSPDAKRIVFARRFGGEGQSELVVAAADGTASHTIARSRYTALTEPAWSPDGRMIAYTTGLTASLWHDFDLVQTNAAGTRVRHLTSSSRHDDTEPAFSPDGRRLAFVRDGAIYVRRRDGRTHRLIGFDTSTSGAWARSPAWSPDGTKIAFVRDSGDGFPALMIVAARARVPALAGRFAPLRRLANGDDPVWSPDGRWIFYIWNGDLVRIAADGGRPKRVLSARRIRPLFGEDLEFSLAGPSLSPAGDRIALTGFGTRCQEPEDSGSDPECSSEARIVLYDRATRRIRGFGFPPTVAQGRVSVTWAPDGRWLLLGGGDLMRVRPNGRELRRVGGLRAGSEADPSWQAIR